MDNSRETKLDLYKRFIDEVSNSFWEKFKKGSVKIDENDKTLVTKVFYVFEEFLSTTNGLEAEGIEIEDVLEEMIDEEMEGIMKKATVILNGVRKKYEKKPKTKKTTSSEKVKCTSMDESFDFNGYILNLHAYMVNTLKFVNANKGILKQDEKSFLFEIVDTINIAVSKDGIYKLGEEWIMNILTRLIDIKFHCIEKGRFPTTLEKSKNSRYFHISLLNRLHSVYHSFRNDFGEFDVDDDYYDGFSKEVEDALDEDCIEDALNSYNEDWLILSIKHLLEIRKKIESAKGKRVTKGHKKAVNTKDEVGVKNPKPAEPIHISCSFPYVWRDVEQTDEMKNGTFFDIISRSIQEGLMGFDMDEIYKKEKDGLFIHSIKEDGVGYDLGKSLL